ICSFLSTPLLSLELDLDSHVLYVERMSKCVDTQADCVDTTGYCFRTGFWEGHWHFLVHVFDRDQSKLYFVIYEASFVICEVHFVISKLAHHHIRSWHFVIHVFGHDQSKLYFIIYEVHFVISEANIVISEVSLRPTAL
ncbi:hypothetical protein Taro_002467, partial [Colocasia esculenta]|nr:hypothetical protein [Colocasia esculenta]